MSTDYVVVGIKPPDEKWKKMKTVWDACRAGGIDVPDEVKKFFNWDTPDDDGVRIELTPRGHTFMGVTKIQEPGVWGFVVELAALPEDIKIVKFEAHC